MCFTAHVCFLLTNYHEYVSNVYNKVVFCILSNILKLSDTSLLLYLYIIKLFVNQQNGFCSFYHVTYASIVYVKNIINGESRS